MDTCSSSCLTVFAAGKNKGVFPISRIGVHSASAINMRTGQSVEHSRTTLLMIRFYKSVGVPASVLGWRQAQQLYCAPPLGQRRIGAATHFQVA
ncbi:hypothetical protein [Bosea sp. BIWAKO-01]|uniref:hypothetical protein n=1 Tax=Bosea sp. BIWAKO-01 TaxID=506668 RepID=UPI00114CAE43|nr:hypothetical protein [Bosea sp. BIWAKO-01]